MGDVVSWVLVAGVLSAAFRDSIRSLIAVIVRSRR